MKIQINKLLGTKIVPMEYLDLKVIYQIMFTQFNGHQIITGNLNGSTLLIRSGLEVLWAPGTVATWFICKPVEYDVLHNHMQGNIKGEPTYQAQQVRQEESFVKLIPRTVKPEW